MLVVAPTANAAFLIGGKSVDSVFGFFPMENNHYSQAQPEKMSKMKFHYDEVKAIFCDEINLVSYLVFFFTLELTETYKFTGWVHETCKDQLLPSGSSRGCTKACIHGCHFLPCLR